MGTTPARSLSSRATSTTSWSPGRRCRTSSSTGSAGNATSSARTRSTSCSTTPWPELPPPDQAGEPLHFTPHDFRTIIATEAVAGGLPVHIAARLLGHTSTTTTEVYLAVFQEDLIRSCRAFLNQGNMSRSTNWRGLSPTSPRSTSGRETPLICW
ncbi:site-specific integrase [Streptomyces canus]|uniref:site-specific integrase n=1 Tax=Streptomyces canus TaxID=58343 RepID=UPI00338D6030